MSQQLYVTSLLAIVTFGHGFPQEKPTNEVPKMIAPSQKAIDPFSEGSAGSGNELQVDCKLTLVSGGRYQFICRGTDYEPPTIQMEHILWLSGQEGQKQVIDVEIPNYKIEEVIKAGFKISEREGTLINLTLRKPELSYDAKVQNISSVSGPPTVQLKYDPVENTVVHFPNDKEYSKLSSEFPKPIIDSGKKATE